MKILLQAGRVFLSLVMFASVVAGCGGKSTSEAGDVPQADAGPPTTRAAATCEALCADQAAGCRDAGADWLSVCTSFCGEVPSRCAPEIDAERVCAQAVGWKYSTPFVLPGDKGPPPDAAPTPQLKDATRCVEEGTAFGACMRGK